MKNLIQYLQLWRKKRSELRIDDDADQDWAGMKSLLDEYMPADNSGGGKKRGISLFSIMLTTLAAAAMVVVTTKVVQKRLAAKNVANKVYRHKGHKFTTTNNDSAAMADTAMRHQDSIIQPKQTFTTENKPLSGALPANNAAVKPGANIANADRHNTGNDKIARASDDNDKRETPPANIDKKTSVINKTAGKPAQGSSPDNAAAISILPTNGIGHRRPANTSSNPLAGDHDNRAISNVVPVVSGQYFYQGNGLNLLEPPRQSLIIDAKANGINFLPSYIVPQVAGKLIKDNKSKNGGPFKVKPVNNAAWEWGLLIGANSSGSFTPKSQNSNFYGSSPVDLFTGVYGTYDLNEKWGIGAQVRFLTPAVIKGTFVSTTVTRSDSATIIRTKSTNDQRKVYSVQVPLYAIYHVNNSLSFKAGPVISFPVKQLNIAADSATRAVFTQAHYDQKTDIGLIGGVSLRYKRLIFEASYLKGLTRHSIALDSLSYRSANSTLQFTIGIQLGRKKK